MNRRVLVLAAVVLGLSGAQAALPDPGPDAVPVKPAKPANGMSDVDSRQRFRLYKTSNIFNLFLLDTRTGKLWQLQWSLDTKTAPRETFVINAMPLADTNQDGRFSLTVTDNVWTGILLDTKTGSSWQCQWSNTTAERGCLVIPQG